MDAIRLPKNSEMVGNSIISGKKIAISDAIFNKPDRLNDE